MTWGAMLGEQLDFYRNAHFWPRIQGVTDEEYLWEPAAGAWSLRPGPDGPWVLDQLPLDPPVAPVTTIAWRVVHVGRDVLGKRARAFFAPGEVPDDVVMYDVAYWPVPPPTTAGAALAFLTEAYGLWRDGVASSTTRHCCGHLGRAAAPTPTTPWPRWCCTSTAR